MKRRIITFLLAALALSLAACGSREKEGPKELAFQYAPNYTAENLTLPLDRGELYGSCTDGASIWYLAGPVREPARLYRADLESGTVEPLEEYQPPETPEVVQVNRYGPVLAPDGTLWVYETWSAYHYDLPEDFDPETDLKGEYFTGRDDFCHLRQLDPRTGKEKKLVDLSEAVRSLDLEDTFGVTDFLVDGKGIIYLAGPGGVAALDGQGKYLFTLEAEMPDTGMLELAGGKLVLLPDGTAAALTTQPKRREVRVIDPAAQTFGEASYPAPSEVGGVISGREPCLFYYIQNDTIYGVVEGDALPQRLLPLENTRLEEISGLVCFALLDGGRAAVLMEQLADDGEPGEFDLRLVLLSPTDQMPEDGKIRLVYGTIEADREIENQVRSFNRKSEKYYIEYRDYTEGALYTADTLEEQNAIWDAARLRVAGEIAAGRAPDIMDSSLPLDVYTRAGYLEDLWPWIDKDPEITREGVMDHVLECASVDGKLYQLCGSFRIDTAIASRAAAGSRTGWTLEEMQSAFGGAMPTIYTGIVQSGISSYRLFTCNAEETMRQLLSMDLDRYVDWDTGECRFDGEEFQDLLRLCSGAGNGEMDYELTVPPLWEGEPALCQIDMYRVEDITAWDVYFGGPESLSAGTYEAALWDAGVLYTFISPYNGQEVVNYKNAGFASYMEGVMNGNMGLQCAADAVYGMPDGKLYASFVGVPTRGGSGSSFTLVNPVAIAAASQAKEGAWEFVRTLLLPGGGTYWDTTKGLKYASSYGFPMNRADFEELLEPQWCQVNGDGELILDKDGQPIEAAAEWPTMVGNPIVMAAYRMAPNQAQLDRFWTLYNAIDHVGGGNDELVGLITEQARPYFAGDKSLAETARLIQNRASLYVNESR